jgi:hypothetical protein
LQFGIIAIGIRCWYECVAINVAILHQNKLVVAR